MRRILAFLIIVLAQAALCMEGRAQTPSRSCPTVSVKCPTGLWDPGQPVTISVEVQSSDAYLTENLKYNWMVSAGVIISGQGTPEITVDTSDLGGQNVTATVEIDGLPAGCDRTESCSLPVALCVLPASRLVHEYGDISESDEKARLDDFAVALEQEPYATAYVTAYGGGTSPDALAHLERIKKYLVEARNIEPGRVTMVDAGQCSQPMVELYVRPPGAVEPVPAPCP